MPVTSVRKDRETKSVTIAAELDAPVERVWQTMADPRQLERWWGLPTHPATVFDHELTPGGRVNYHLTGPEGDQMRGWWRVVAVDAPRRLEFVDGFGEDVGNTPAMSIVISLDEGADGGTDMVLVATYPSPENMEMMINMMGGIDNMGLSVAQLDGVLAS